MKYILQLLLLLTIINPLFSQEKTVEKFGKTLNLGVGIGYYGYIGRSAPVLHFDFEFDIIKNFTLAPFVTLFTYQNNRYWGDYNNPNRNYYYRQTIVPVGIKGTYYFDQLLHAGSKWDFYLAGSLGYTFRRTTWESGYYGDRIVESSNSSLYLDGHIGTELHLSKTVGLYLDLSTGISTFGLGLHL